ncbi:H/ACA RNA-protein complex protein Gar1 [Candidatus Bathyarchaeota archaeon]|nr:MAG: H/ACA RNA-protein complex protein Gar1 [Candidatus Bathyarchaeota archaeon]
MKGFERIGVVSHLSFSSGNLILKAEWEPKIGEPVYDWKKRKIGRVFDLFGPVASPFISVHPTVENPERYVGKPLYVKANKRLGK